MHAVARKTAERSAVVGGVGETGRIDEPVVLAPGHSNHPVWPKGIGQVSRICLENGAHGRSIRVSGGLDDEAGLRKVVAGAIQKAVHVGPPLRGLVEVLPYRVALSAHLGRYRWLQP